MKFQFVFFRETVYDKKVARLRMCNQGPGYDMDSGFVVTTNWNLVEIQE